MAADRGKEVCVTDSLSLSLSLFLTFSLSRFLSLSLLCVHASQALPPPYDFRSHRPLHNFTTVKPWSGHGREVIAHRKPIIALHRTFLSHTIDPVCCCVC